MTQEVNLETVANLQEVVIEKDKLLEIIKDNREKHNAIYEAAVAGYWIKAEETVDKKLENFTKSVDEVTEDFHTAYVRTKQAIKDKDKETRFSYSSRVNIDNTWGLTFPQNHLDSYTKAIKMIELSVFDKVSLSSEEFDSYVLNDWGWKKNFLATNVGYIAAYTGCMFNAGSGYSPNAYSNQVLFSGTNAF